MIRFIKLTILLYFLFWGEVQECFSKPREVEVKTTYSYVLPITESEAYGKQVAELRAKLDAIEKEFGTVISLQNFTEVNSRNGLSDVSFTSKGLSEVKGEWIQNLSAPRFIIERTDGVTVIKCSVHGIVREIISEPVSFECSLLCNGTTAKFERSDFHNGDDLYMSFTSPVDGHIAVYLRDEDRNAFRLLPYPSSTTGSQRVDANHKYVFFSHDTAEPELQGQTMAYHMTASSSLEHNFIYVVFSPVPFTIPLDYSADEYGIRQLSFEEYEKWIGRMRRKNQAVQVLELPISISN